MVKDLSQARQILQQSTVVVPSSTNNLPAEPTVTKKENEFSSDDIVKILIESLQQYSDVKSQLYADTIQAIRWGEHQKVFEQLSQLARNALNRVSSTVDIEKILSNDSTNSKS